MVVTQPKQFRVKANGFNDVKKKYLWRLIPIIVLAIILGVCIAYFNLNHEKGVDALSLPIIIGFCILYLGIRIYSNLNRDKALFESFTLTIEPYSIFRDQLNTPSIHIYHSEVTQISRLKNGDLLIKSEDSNNLIGIPAQIENKEELEALLNQIKTIDDTPRLTLDQKYPYLITLLYIGLMGLVFISENRFIVPIAGALLISYILWAYFKSRKNNNIDQGTRNKFLWYPIVIIAVIVKVAAILLQYL